MVKQPHLLVGEGDVNGIVLTPGDSGRVNRIVKQYENVEEIVQNRGYEVANAEHEGVSLTIFSIGIGCSSAAIVIEEFARAGVEMFVRIGIIDAL